MKNHKQDKQVLVLRTCAEDMTSNNGGFQWPESGHVEAPDWQPTPVCGSGLHGWLWGSGDWSMKTNDPCKWIVVEVSAETIIDLGGKVKFQRGNVLFVAGTWHEAMEFIRGHAHYQKNVKQVATGDNGHASASCDNSNASATGNFGHASATGCSGHASATGDFGNASAAGNFGHASATGCSGHASATGYFGNASAAGNFGHASTTGCSGHASATGNNGHASATGYFGHASATGNNGHASATGKYGVAIAGNKGSAKADASGCVAVLYWDEDAKRPRIAVGYVGEGGIKANTWYCVKNGALKEEVE